MGDPLLKKYLNEYSLIDNETFRKKLLVEVQEYVSTIDMAAISGKNFGFHVDEFYKIEQMLEFKYYMRNCMMSITCGSYNAVFRTKNEKIVKFYFGKNWDGEFDNDVYISKKLAGLLKKGKYPELADMVCEPLAYDPSFEIYFLYEYYVIHILCLIRLYFYSQGHRYYSITKSNVFDILTMSSPGNKISRIQIIEIVDSLFYTNGSQDIYYRKLFTNILESVFERFNIPRLHMFSDFKKLHKFLQKKTEYFVVDTEKFPTSHALLYDMGVSAVRDNFIRRNYGGIKGDRYFKLMFLCTTMFLLSLVSQGIHFCHNDLKPDNILVFRNTRRKRIRFRYQDLSFTVREPFIFKLSDFGLSHFQNDPMAMENKDRPQHTAKNSWRDDVSKFMEMFNTYFEQRIRSMGKFYELILEYNKITDPIDKTHFFLEMLHSKLFDEWRDRK